MAFKLSQIFNKVLNAFARFSAKQTQAWIRYKNENPQSILTMIGEDDYAQNWLNSATGNAVTQADIQANEMQMQNVEDLYQRQVTGMQKAGLNPALMYGSGSQSAPQVQAQPARGGISDVLNIISFKKQLAMMSAQSQMFRDQGEAALITARANERNAGTNEFNAETNRMRQEIDAWVARYDIQVAEATVNKLASETAQINIFTQQLPERLSILHQSADAQTKQATASLQSALAASRQAAVSEKLSDSEIALRQSQVLLNWAVKDGQNIVNKYIGDEQMAKIRELQSRSDFLDANAKNMDRNAKVQWMQTITGYTHAACEIVDAVGNVIGMIPGSPSKIGF